MADTINFTTLGLTGTGPVKQIGAKLFSVGNIVPNDITSLYGGAQVTAITGAATTYNLTYPLAPAYNFLPNAGVNLHALMPVYDATKQQNGQPITFINNGGAGSILTPNNSSGSQIGAPIGSLQRLECTTNSAGLDGSLVGSAASCNASDPNESNVASTHGAFTANNVVVAADSVGTVQDGGVSVSQISTNTSNIASITPSYSSFTSASNITLNNPGGGSFTAATLMDISLTAAGQAVTLPDMTGSPLAVGMAYIIRNPAVSSNFSYIVNDKSGTTLYRGLAPGQYLILEITNKGTSAGTFRVRPTGPSISINPQTGTTYTLAASDNGKLVTLSNASAITLTIPALFIGFNCKIKQIDAGQVTASGSGITLNSANSALKTRAQYSGYDVIQDTASTMQLDGDLVL
jgi:hypothetical protein